MIHAIVLGSSEFPKAGLSGGRGGLEVVLCPKGGEGPQNHYCVIKGAASENVDPTVIYQEPLPIKGRG